jgi:hypothetical protein
MLLSTVQNDHATMIRDGTKGTLPNLASNNVSELLGFFIHR